MNAETETSRGPQAAISRDVVGLLKELTGRGPTKSKTYLHQDCVFLLLREGHTRSEETMFQAGAPGAWRRVVSTCRRRFARR